jgi:hypothetical protein
MITPMIDKNDGVNTPVNVPNFLACDMLNYFFVGKSMKKIVKRCTKLFLILT